MLDPILIDPATFASEREVREGSLSLSSLDERVATHDYFANQHAVFHFVVKGGVDKWQRPFLDLSVQADAELVCQRCLQPMPFTFQEDSHIVLFANEARLDEAMLADDELEGMLLADELSVRELVEDQILMALPYSPKHESCAENQVAAINQDKPNPFAVLAGLKK